MKQNGWIHVDLCAMILQEIPLNTIFEFLKVKRH